MSNELGVESFIDEEESDLINSLFLDGVDSSDSILNSQKREGDEERALGGVSEKELSGVNEKELIGVEKEAGQSQDVKETFEGVDDKEDAFEGVSDVGATEEKAVANEKEVVVNEEEVVMVAEEKEEKKSEEMVIEEEEKEEKNEEKEEKEEKEKKEEENEKDEQNAITTNEKEENTTNNEKQEQNNTKPTRRSPRIQNRRKPSPREETTEDAQPENAPVPIDIVEDSVVINPPSALRAQQNIRISEPRKMTLRPRTKKSPTTQRTKKSPTKRTKKSPSKRTKRANTEMLSQPPAVEEAVRKRRRRDTDCETQRSEVGLEERVRDSRNERRSAANARLIELGILRTTTSSDVWRARWQ